MNLSKAFMKHLVKFIIFLSKHIAEKKILVNGHTCILHVKTLATGVNYFLKNF